MGHREYLAGRGLPEALLFTLLNSIRLKQHFKFSFLKQVSLSESLGQERGEDQSFLLSLLFIDKQLKVNIPKVGFRVAGFWFHYKGVQGSEDIPHKPPWGDEGSRGR